MKLATSIITAILLPLTLYAADITGKCIGVSDGDTITVLVNNEQVKVRLEGVDCPESHQDYGSKAKQFTSDLVFGKEVTVRVAEKDRYGRSVGRVMVGDTDLNLELVKAGLAWHYKAYSKDKELAAAEAKAREDKVGLWSQNAQVPPWEFRKGKKAIETKAEAKEDVQGVEKAFWLNTGSGVRHNSGCKNYGKTKSGRACGKDEGKACGICGG